MAELSALRDASDSNDPRFDTAERNIRSDIAVIFGETSTEFQHHKGQEVYADGGRELSDLELFDHDRVEAHRMKARRAGIESTTAILKGLLARVRENAEDAELGATAEVPRRAVDEKMIGEWRVVRPLRPGGQGDVKLVERVGPKEHALGVMKHLPPHLAEEQQRLGRMKHEIETIRALRHPFIAELLDFNFKDLWFVTRYAPMGSLNDHLSWFRGDAWRTLRMARDMAVALAVAHEKNIIHRDVKPGNILVRDPNHFVLTDFGIAHDPDQTEATRPGEWVGARWFSPPEADGRSQPTPAFDIYMLGKVIYTALTGGGRFPREQFAEGDANIVAMLGRSEFAAINKLLGSMVVANPEQRFQTSGRVVDEIDGVLSRLYGGGPGKRDYRLVFAFGDTGGQRYSGDHPGLQMVPVWMPTTSSLVIDIRFHQGVRDPLFAVEFWDDKVKVIDSGHLKPGRNEIAVTPTSSGQWMSLRIRRENSWGSANISNLSVHALSGDN